MIDGKNFFDQPINSTLKTYENIREIATGQGDDYTTGCLLDYNYFKNYYKVIAVDLSKQQGFMLILNQFKKLILLQTQKKYKKHLEIQKSISFLKKHKKLFLIFARNCKSFVNKIS